ncbi:MAG: Wzt carbohydrate-binding domain-containing protein, partial [Peptostreptococcaceae bacterium]|nr:Wzt carbohydrate-binding domain-containing protein [Peptostreptococcaceae bacterium]
AGIGEYIDQPVKTYSSGMFARIAFAVAINMDPDILIVDETLSVGDIAFQAKCVSKMRKMKDAGLTLLFVSHSVDAIKSLCNRAILLEKGRLIDMGTSEAIVNKYLASIREDMNAENREEELESTEEVEAIAEEDTLQVEIDLMDTNQWVEQFTYGEGEVYFTKVEMLNAKKEKTLAFDFGEEAILRCHISAKARYENVNISFLIRDITGIDLFGTTMFDEKIDLLKTIEGVIIDEVDSRVYQNSEALGCLIGYTDNITKEELEKYKGKDYNSQSKIGKSGLEQVYEDKLRARDGVHIFIKRGEEKITLAKTEPINGENIKLSIDSKLQENIYAQMNNEKGASVALHPQTGEVLAMVSSPS